MEFKCHILEFDCKDGGLSYLESSYPHIDTSKSISQSCKNRAIKQKV